MRPVKTEKHETSWTNLAQDATTTQIITLITAQAGEPVIPTDIETGSTVRWIFLEFNLNGVDNSGTAQVFHWVVYKSPQGAIVVDPILYDTINKKHILKRGMEMLPQIPLGSGGTVQTKRVFTVKIPRGLSRFGEQDQLRLAYKSTSASGINFCGIAIFKEFK